MIKQSSLALFVASMVTGSFYASAAEEHPSNYQQSESVSSTVYSSQQLEPAVSRNVELVKPSAESLSLAPVKILSVSEVGVESNLKRKELLTTAPKGQEPEKPLLNLASKPVVPAKPDVPAKPEKSLLSFIDDWLGIKPVKPWQKGTLAKKEMKPGGVVPEFDVFSEKVFSYKQGSVGGNGVGGGGCGCN